MKINENSVLKKPAFNSKILTYQEPRFYHNYVKRPKSLSYDACPNILLIKKYYLKLALGKSAL